MKYFIINCLSCHKFPFYVRSDRKTKQCPYCGKTIRLDYSKVRIIKTYDNVREAREAVSELKARKMATSGQKTIF